LDHRVFKDRKVSVVRKANRAFRAFRVQRAILARPVRKDLPVRQAQQDHKDRKVFKVLLDRKDQKVMRSVLARHMRLLPQ
jgi:hypothetical protein